MPDLQELVDGLAARLGRPVAIEDRRYRVLAYSAHAEPLDRVRMASILTREAPADLGSVACRLCGEPVRPGELYTAAARCLMGGEVPLDAHAALYADTLEIEAEHLRCRAAREGGEAVCFTIGHGTRPLEELVALLRAQDVAVLADIRTVPRSRHNPQYGTEALAAALPEHGLCYLHLPELGGLRKPRPDSPNGGWRNDSFRGYADYMLTPGFEAALEELIALLRRRRTAIMCAETAYWRCHRALVADALLVRGIPAFHVMGEGTPAPHRLTRFARPEGTRLRYPPEATEDPASLPGF